MVTVNGANVGLDAGSVVDASGGSGGGEVFLGGGIQGKDETLTNSTSTVVEKGAIIRADALSDGTGGTVVAWADGDTMFAGEASARGVSGGGFVEISGKGSLEFDGTVDTTAMNGTAGTLLLDPTNFRVTTAASSANNVQNTALQTALASNNVVLSTQSAGGDAGWISVEADVNWNSGFSLTLLAEESIYFSRDLKNAGSGNLNLLAGWDSTNFPFATIGGSGTASSTPFAALPSGDVNMATAFANLPAFGNNNGSIVIGRSQSGASGNGVEIGSRAGATNAIGYGMELAGSNSTTNGYAHLGLIHTAGGTGPSGSIQVELGAGGLAVTGGNANGAYAQ
ncbi:MAG: hypothetical protein KDM63_21485, partial [Verrucomicrobiae bacterium]|nr:hypothetical protein [Verrucomicrobiae bacterium]